MSLGFSWEASPRVRFSWTYSRSGREELGAFFSPFFTTKQGRSEHMGLGLSVSYGIVTENGGSINKGKKPQSQRVRVGDPFATPGQNGGDRLVS